jgi:hypothetical protein
LHRSERACYLLEADICCCEIISPMKKHGHQLLVTQPHPGVSHSPSLGLQPQLYQAQVFTAQCCLLSPGESRADQPPRQDPSGHLFSGPPSVLLRGLLWGPNALSILLSQWKTVLGVLHSGLSHRSQKKLPWTRLLRRVTWKQ